MFSFRESYFRLVGSFDWVYAKTKLILSVSRNRYGFTLAGYRNEKYATDPALLKIVEYECSCEMEAHVEVTPSKRHFNV